MDIFLLHLLVFLSLLSSNFWGGLILGYPQGALCYHDDWHFSKGKSLACCSQDCSYFVVMEGSLFV